MTKTGNGRIMSSLFRILKIRISILFSISYFDIRIFKEIQEMNKTGISFLLVEQNARKGLSVSHRGCVLELGRNRLTGTGQELLNNKDVQRLYLGG